jgi:catechol 2,3-dioxygenase-like lactoylglutathione lyase family enzyme/GNAT superfamily N-acetyltransferase
MNLNQVTVPSTDVARAVAFYQRLGLTLIVLDLPGYARFECPNGATFSVHNHDTTPSGGGPLVYFECDELDASVRRLRAAGIEFEALPQDQPWLWREAYLRDPDGNRLCLYHAGRIRRYPPWRLRPSGDAPAPAHTITIEPQPSADDIHRLGAGLTEHALATTGTAGFEPVGVFARDAEAAIVGGITAFINWNWLHVSLVWVSASLRGTGLGHRLLTAIEEEGIRRGCRFAHLDTFSYQARPFYERHGYTLFATLEDYPPGQQRFFMRKTLGTTAGA